MSARADAGVVLEHRDDRGARAAAGVWIRSTNGRVRRVVAQSRWPTRISAGRRPRPCSSGRCTPSRSGSEMARERVAAARSGSATSRRPRSRRARGAGSRPASWPRSSSSWTARRPRSPHVDRHLVDPHPDEAVRDARVHAAREAHRVGQRVLRDGRASSATVSRTRPREARHQRPRPRSRRTALPPSGRGRPVSLLPPRAEVERPCAGRGRRR